LSIFFTVKTNHNHVWNAHFPGKGSLGKNRAQCGTTCSIGHHHSIMNTCRQGHKGRKAAMQRASFWCGLHCTTTDDRCVCQQDEERDNENKEPVTHHWSLLFAMIVHSTIHFLCQLESHASCQQKEKLEKLDNEESWNEAQMTVDQQGQSTVPFNLLHEQSQSVDKGQQQMCSVVNMHEFGLPYVLLRGCGIRRCFCCISAGQQAAVHRVDSAAAASLVPSC